MTDPPPTSGSVQVAVTRDDSPAQGVPVRLFTAGGSTPTASGTTGSNGAVSFTEVAAGTYDVEIDVPDGTTLDGGAARRPVTVSAGGTASLTFRLVSAPATGVVEVRLTSGSTFNPADVLLAQGATVRWVNDVQVLHTITPLGHEEWAEAEVAQAGDTFEHTFENAGVFEYVCTLHAGMNGVVRVQ